MSTGSPLSCFRIGVVVYVSVNDSSSEGCMCE